MTHTNKIQSYSISVCTEKGKCKMEPVRTRYHLKATNLYNLMQQSNSLISILTTDLTLAPPLLPPERMYVDMCVEASS